MGNPIAYLDVFAEKRYAGNQLAVIRQAADITDDEMQALARETNFSETTFILRDEPERDGGYAVRIFTPREEIPFAGHPTLGTAFVILQDILGGRAKEVTLDLKVGPIRVKKDGDILWMRQNAPTFGPPRPPQEFAAMLGLDEKDIDARLPIQDVSTGLAHVIVPLTSRAALRRAKVDLPRYERFASGPGAKSLCAFSTEGPAMRVFPIYYGIAEDPATGSAAGCLAGYLSKHKALGAESVKCTIEQGIEMGRPSALHLRARPGTKDIEIDVGGSVVRVMDGRLSR